MERTCVGDFGASDMHVLSMTLSFFCFLVAVKRDGAVHWFVCLGFFMDEFEFNVIMGQLRRCASLCGIENLDFKTPAWNRVTQGNVG